MKTTRGLTKVFVLLATAAALAFVGARFVAQAVENNPGFRVDGTPIHRDIASGNSYAPVVKKVAPSVVNIYSTHIVKQRYYRNPLMADPFFRQFFGDQYSDDGREITKRYTALGSGIIVTPDGYIITASHVVEGADEIKVGVQNDSTKYDAKVIGMDPPTDVAILKIQAKNLPAVTLGDSDQLEVGDVVLAIGNPFGVGQTVTRGIISALSRTISAPDDSDTRYGRQYQDFIQTDAAINQGNSGGALVDTEGRLIGVNDAIVSPSANGGSVGIGFAIPINMARNVMEGFLSGGKVTRGYLGIDPQDIDAGLAKGFGAPSTQGALVSDVEPDSPAAKAGLQSGDVIISINDKEVSSADNLRVIVSQIRPGSQASLKVYRNGAARTVTVTMAERPDSAVGAVQPTAPPSAAEPAQADALDGVSVQDLNPRLRRQLHTPENFAGALVSAVDNNSNSYDAGMRPGDVITEINHQTVANAEDAKRLGHAALTEQILLKIWRPVPGGGVTRFVSVDNTRRTK